MARPRPAPTGSGSGSGGVQRVWAPCNVALALTPLVVVVVAYCMADLGCLEEGGDFGNPSERTERALRGSGLTGE